MSRSTALLASALSGAILFSNIQVLTSKDEGTKDASVDFSNLCLNSQVISFWNHQVGRKVQTIQQESTVEEDA